MQKYFDFFVHHWLLTTLIFVIIIAIAIVNVLERMINAAKVSSEAAVRLINHENAIVIDIRKREAFKERHIINSINIPFQTDEEFWNKFNQYKTRPIILVCQHGVSVMAVANKLLKSGFAKVVVLNKGISGWLEANLPTEK